MAGFNYHQQQQQMMMMEMINSSSFNSMIDDDHDGGGGGGVKEEFFDLKQPLNISSCDDINNYGMNWSSLQQTVSEFSYHHHQNKNKKKKMAAAAFCSSSRPQVISFGSSSNPFLQPAEDYNSDVNLLLDDDMVCKKPKYVSRSPLQAQYHVEAERKRREKLSELFISLSRIIPGLKKLDKATLLGDAIKYMKELQERVKFLEQETNNRIRNSMSMEFDDDHDDGDDAMRTNKYSSNISAGCSYNSLLSSSSTCKRGVVNQIHEIRVRVMNNNLLIKIHCDQKSINNNNNGSSSFVARIPAEMEKLNLSILDIRVIPFGSSILDIAILAQMEREYPPTVKDIIKHMQQINILDTEDNQTLMSSDYNSFSEDCFHHLSPLSGSEDIWQE